MDAPYAGAASPRERGRSAGSVRLASTRRRPDGAHAGGRPLDNGGSRYFDEPSAVSRGGYSERGHGTAPSSRRRDGVRTSHAASTRNRRLPQPRGGRRPQNALDRVFDAARTVPLPVYGALAVALALVLIVPGAVARNAGEAAAREAAEQKAQAASAAKASAKAQAEAIEEFELTAASFDDIPTDEGLVAYALSDLDAPEIPADETRAVEHALAAIEEHGSVSMVFVDAETGRGLAYQPDLAVYGASSFKALYALYICEDLVESGAATLDDYCSVNYAVDAGGGYAGGSYPVSSLIEAAIVDSNNNAYGALRDAYDFPGFDAWVTSHGAADAVYRADSWFPTYCARSSARLWAEMLSYTSADSEVAQWLADLTAQTTESFIRDGLEGTGATVRDKAGWCTDPDPDYNSVCDAGIVEVDGKTYIMSIMTGMPDSESNRALVGDLARALLDCKDGLRVENSAEA